MIVASPTDPATYQNLSLLVSAFEEAALRSESRQGIMVVMNGPLDGMDQILEGSQNTLTRIQGARRTTGVGVPQVTPTDSFDDRQSGSESKTHDLETSDRTELDEDGVVTGHVDRFGVEVEAAEKDGLLPSPPSVVATGGIHLDSDLASIFGADGERADEIQAMMKECYGCDLRLSFDWELGPFDLLGPIADFVNDINAALDKLEKMTNPLNLLRDFCGSLNDFRFFCPPDIIAILLALKMLFKKYLISSLEIRLDWTVVLGPLIQLIVEAIADLIQQLAGIIIAPLDCAIAVLETFEQLEDEIRDTVATVKATGTAAKVRLAEISTGGLLPNVSFEVNNRDLIRDPESGRFSSRSRNRDDEQSKNTWGTVLSGFDLDVGRDLRGLIQRDDTNWVSTLTSAVVEARDYVQDLVNQIVFTLRSMKGLVGGGLTVQLEALGMLTLLLQLIRMVLMLWDMLRSDINPADWCEFIEEHPTFLQDKIQHHLDSNAKLVAADGRTNLTIYGHTGEIFTCVSNRTSVDQNVLSQWIDDLTRGPA